MLSFRYTRDWHLYAALVTGVAAMALIEGLIVDVLIVIFVQSVPLRFALLGIVLLLHLLLISAIFLPPLVTRHILKPTELHVRYGYDRLVIPRAALSAARSVTVPLDLFGQIRARLDSDRGRIVACFSTQGQLLLTLDQPTPYRVAGITAPVHELLINVDRRDDLLAALSLPDQHPTLLVGT